jgi:hypothetical protein
MGLPYLEDWPAVSVADAQAQQRPVAVAFFSPGSFREFLRAVIDRDQRADDQADDKDAQPADSKRTSEGP